MMHTFKRITLIIIVNICKFLPVGVAVAVLCHTLLLTVLARASVGWCCPLQVGTPSPVLHAYFLIVAN